MIINLVDERPKFASSEKDPQQEYVSLLIRLHELMRSDAEQQAEQVREQMDLPGLFLDEKQIQRVKGLSADLYMLAGDEVLQPNEFSEAQYVSKLREAVTGNDSDTVLSLLRLERRPLEPDHIAYMRAIAYQYLGLDDAAKVFARLAVDLAPENIAHRVLLSQHSDDPDIAAGILRLSDVTFNDPDAPPGDIIKAAGALFFSVSDNRDSDARVRLGKARQALRRLFSSINPGQIPDVGILGMVLLGAILDALNRANEARDVLEEAARLDPNEHRILIVLGTSWLRDSRRKAIPYFRRAVELGSSNFMAHVVLATEALESGQTEEYKHFSQRLVELVQEAGMAFENREFVGPVYQFLGLAEWQQNGPTDRAIAYLEQAMRLSPESERLTNSYHTLVAANANQPGTMDREKDFRKLSLWFSDLQSNLPSAASFLYSSMKPSAEQWGFSRAA